MTLWGVSRTRENKIVDAIELLDGDYIISKSHRRALPVSVEGNVLTVYTGRSEGSYKDREPFWNCGTPSIGMISESMVVSPQEGRLALEIDYQAGATAILRIERHDEHHPITEAEGRTFVNIRPSKER